MVHCVFPPAVDEAEAGQQEEKEADQDCSPDGRTDLLVATLQLSSVAFPVQLSPSPVALLATVLLLVSVPPPQLALQSDSVQSAQ